MALIGDGGMSAQLPAVPMAVEQGLPVIFVVMNNRAHGTIADLQAANFGSSYGCEFTDPDGSPYSPDFAALARACGADGYASPRRPTSATALRRGAAATAARRARRADGQRAGADARALEHQGHLPGVFDRPNQPDPQPEADVMSRRPRYGLGSARAVVAVALAAAACSAPGARCPQRGRATSRIRRQHGDRARSRSRWSTRRAAAQLAPRAVRGRGASSPSTSGTRPAASTAARSSSTSSTTRATRPSAPTSPARSTARATSR